MYQRISIGNGSQESRDARLHRFASDFDTAGGIKGAQIVKIGPDRTYDQGTVYCAKIEGTPSQIQRELLATVRL